MLIFVNHEYLAPRYASLAGRGIATKFVLLKTPPILFKKSADVAQSVAKALVICFLSCSHRDNEGNILSHYLHICFQHRKNCPMPILFFKIL